MYVYITIRDEYASTDEKWNILNKRYRSLWQYTEENELMY